VEDEQLAALTADGVAPKPSSEMSADQHQRAAAQAAYSRGALKEALAAWRSQPREPHGPMELLMVAEALAHAGDDSALRYIDQLRSFEGVEADALVGVLRWRQGRFDEATDALEVAFHGYRHDPWPMPEFMSRQLDVAAQLGVMDAGLALRLYSVIRTPFSSLVLDQQRRLIAFKLATHLGHPYCVDALQALEPLVPWRRDVLFDRLQCYRDAHHRNAARARADLNAYLAAVPLPLAHGLEMPVMRASR
jgi:hypothetical protein